VKIEAQVVVVQGEFSNVNNNFYLEEGKRLFPAAARSSSFHPKEFFSELWQQLPPLKISPRQLLITVWCLKKIEGTLKPRKFYVYSL
jgi:hypothetical protein